MAGLEKALYKQVLQPPSLRSLAPGRFHRKFRLPFLGTLLESLLGRQAVVANHQPLEVY